MDVTLPNGKVIKGVPDGTTKAELAQKLQANGMDVPKEWLAQKEGAQPSSTMPAEYRALQAGREFARGIGLGGRTILNAFTSAPLMAADAGIAIRNAMSGTKPQLWNPKTNRYEDDPNFRGSGEKENYESASSMWNQALNDLGVPHPENTGEKVADLAGQMLIGSKIPAPEASIQAPSNFSTVDPTRIAALKEAQKAGYVVPPATTNPTTINNVLNKIGGKTETVQDAMKGNTEVTNRLVNRALEQPEGNPITKSVLNAIRKEAGEPYEAIRKVGVMRADSKYAADLEKIGEKFQGASADFPELASPEVKQLIDGMKKKSFDSNSAVDAISILRDKASTAYAKGDKTLGKAYRSVSTALEDAIERALERRGDSGKAMLEAFREGRATIAKTYSVEKALNDSAGLVDATKLANQLSKGAPLSGDLLTVAKAGQAFPKPLRPMMDTGSAWNTDMAIGTIGAAASKEPSLLAYPFSRQMARDFMLSKVGQRMAIPAAEVDRAAQAQALAQLLSRQSWATP